MKPEEAWARRISPGRRRCRWRTPSAASTSRARSSCSPTGPTASPQANCRPPSRRARRASSATSSSRCGTGPIPRPICTTRSRPTSAIPRSTPTARSTARPRTAPTSSPCSIPRRTRRPRSKCRCAIPRRPTSKNNGMAPSPYWGEEAIWDSQTSMHNPMMDEKGRVWFTSRVRQSANPDFCQQGLRSSFGEAVPDRAVHAPPLDVRSQDRQDHADPHLLPHASSRSSPRMPTTRCGPAPAGRRAASSAGSTARMFDETGDEAKSQGWTALVLDTNGNGKRDEDYVEPNQPVDPTKDKRITGALYGIGINPVDSTVWGSVLDFPGLRHPRQSGRQPAGDDTGRNLRAAAARATGRAAWTSTATAWSGCRCRAGIWRASTAASARARSTARPPPASIARKAGRSIRSPVRSCRT